MFKFFFFHSSSTRFRRHVHLEFGVFFAHGAQSQVKQDMQWQQDVVGGAAGIGLITLGSAPPAGVVLLAAELDQPLSPTYGFHVG